MKSLASLSLRSAKLVLPVAALLMAIGGAAAATPAHAAAHAAEAHQVAAPQAPGKAAAFTWHPLTLENGWKSASTKGLPTGAPAWASRDGVIYLRGAIKQPNSGASSTFATLPKAARPPQQLYIQIYTQTDVPGILYIGTNGMMQAYDGNADMIASLAAVSYPTHAVTSHQLTLKDGWQSSASRYHTGNPAYAVSNGVVYLSGSLHHGTSQLAFVLPKAARPAHTMFISVYSFDGATGWLVIKPSGQVDVDGPAAIKYTSLANIAFPVASTKWHAFRLINGWKSAGSIYGTAAPEYAVLNGVVYLNGSMHHAAGGTSFWTSIPKAAQPVSVLDIEAYTFGGAAGAVTMAQNDGFANSSPASYADGQTSLASISYPPGS